MLKTKVTAALTMVGDGYGFLVKGNYSLYELVYCLQSIKEAVLRVNVKVN
jgi:hypothetical protein